ncbi:hypothetical protein ACFQBY_02530 [Promicromonospora citrea]|uniref:hypothetical protein n=1 Tax=Promicromonospora citrea TaxID=43677 RepID=UPI0014898B12|nr:hypothetical protein [Promicromonospora citrea]NNH52422.1 hypothetical protein [Promicromonospora citrea]
MIGRSANDVSEDEARLASSYRGDARLALTQPRPLIFETRAIGGVEWGGGEESVVLVHLGVHLREDGERTLTTLTAVFGCQYPHRLGFANERSSQHSEVRRRIDLPGLDGVEREAEVFASKDE